ncbi:MAG: hypothetical protein KJO26_14505, partial [Deltaproteobacteria bacterium]|nr:hypothetical protein [Deltaproteobacteria bacterium]
VTIRSTLSESIETILFELSNMILPDVSIALFIDNRFVSFNNTLYTSSTIFHNLKNSNNKLRKLSITFNKNM